MAVLVSLAMCSTSTLFEIKPFILIPRECQPFKLSGSQMVEFLPGDLDTGFRLTSPDSLIKGTRDNFYF